MCYDHGILDFIRNRLDESVKEEACTEFTASHVWMSVQDCHAPAPYGENTFSFSRCQGCWDPAYPCKKTRLVAESWSDHKEFDESWRIR